MNWDRLFHYLMRVNAIGIFLFLAFAGSTIIYQWLESRYFSPRQSAWGSDTKHKALYTGQELKTRNGSVISYEVADSEGMGRREGGNVSFVNMKTGSSLKVAPENSSVVNWEILFSPGSNDRVAVAYMAFVSTSEQFKNGRMDLVVGTLPDLQQSTVARNILYGDLPTVQGDGSLAIIMWPDEDTAVFVTVDLTSGKILSRNQVPLPRVGHSMTTEKGGLGVLSQFPQGAKNDYVPTDSIAF
jgi:hypothetical protein